MDDFGRKMSTTLPTDSISSLEAFPQSPVESVKGLFCAPQGDKVSPILRASPVSTPDKSAIGLVSSEPQLYKLVDVLGFQHLYARTRSNVFANSMTRSHVVGKRSRWEFKTEQQQSNVNDFLEDFQ